jgi:2-iminobutanoate/2-iminopropanoate deaminase
MEKTYIGDQFFPNPNLSHAIRVGDHIFTSGECAIDLATGAPVPGDVAAQTRKVLDNLRIILEAAGSSLEDAVKASVFLRNFEDFDAFNAAYRAYFPKNPPCRTTTQAGRLGLDFLVEIDLIAVARNRTAS